MQKVQQIISFLHVFIDRCLYLVMQDLSPLSSSNLNGSEQITFTSYVSTVKPYIYS